MTWLMKVPVFARAWEAVRRRTRGAWTRDRAPLRGLKALGNRAARIVILAVRGIFAHRIGLQVGALTYYTVFAIVPTLVVVLWSLKLLDHLPSISDQLPADVRNPTGNQLVQAVLGQILEAVKETSEITSGVIGLGVLLFAVSKMFIYTERALHIIAASGQTTPSLWRTLGYVALLCVPPVVLAIAGVLLALVRAPTNGALSRLLGSVPGLEIAVGLAVGFGALWLIVTLLYTSAARARLPFSSAAVGSAVAALALIVIFWVFANIQIGASHASPLTSGFFAIPVFLVWVSSSWYAVLVGAEIAVAHRVDRVLVHGARAFRLDGIGERQAGVAIMVRLTALSASAGVVSVSEDTLARDLRLPPNLVRDLCFRLVDRGLLSNGVGFSLHCDPARTTSSRVAEAIDRDPALHGVDAGRASPSIPDASLQELAGRLNSAR